MILDLDNRELESCLDSVFVHSHWLGDTAMQLPGVADLEKSIARLEQLVKRASLSSTDAGGRPPNTRTGSSENSCSPAWRSRS